MRSSPNPHCSTCDRLMVVPEHGHDGWICLACDLPPAVEVVTAAGPTTNNQPEPEPND